MLLNSKTQTLLESFYSRPSGSLLIEGTIASGVIEVLDSMYEQLLGKENIGNTFVIKVPASESIGIDIARELKSKMTTVAGAEREITRIAVILNAENLTLQAQNALLKLIEEPIKNSVLILQTANKSTIIETIQSRCQTIPILQISEKQASIYAQEIGKSAEECKKAYLLSQGKAKLFVDLLNGAESELITLVTTAKSFLTQGVFDRLMRAKEFDTRETLTQLIDNLELVAEAGLHSSTTSTSNRWQKVLKEVTTTKELLKSNTNIKLVLLRLSIMV